MTHSHIIYANYYRDQFSLFERSACQCPVPGPTMSPSTSTVPQADDFSPQTPDPTKVNKEGPQGAIKYKGYATFAGLAHILGLDTKEVYGLSGKAAVKAWMASDSFKPAYDELVRDWIDSRWDKAIDGMIRKRAPRLKKIADAISQSPERYSSQSGIINKD